MSKKLTFRNRTGGIDALYDRVVRRDRKVAPFKKGGTEVSIRENGRHLLPGIFARFTGRAFTGLAMTLLLSGLWLLGCSEEFEPFNGVDKLRVLSLQAEPPALAEGGISVITPLVYTADDAPLTYKWSWCPIAASSSEGGGCVVDEETVKDIIASFAEDQLGDDAAALLESFPFSFDLGDGPTTQFIYAIPAELLSNLCTQLISQEIPSFIGVPQCDTFFNVVIRLEVTQGETTLQAVKKIPLYIDRGRATNNNPYIDGVGVTADSGKTATAPLIRGKWYDLTADISEAVIDSYTPFPTEEEPNPVAEKELLFMTWYVTGGETDAMRTSYIDGEVPFKALKRNRWKIPSEHDFPGDIISLFLVLQDEQGGAGWLVRDFEIKEE